LKHFINITIIIYFLMLYIFYIYSFVTFSGWY